MLRLLVSSNCQRIRVAVVASSLCKPFIGGAELSSSHPNQESQTTSKQNSSYTAWASVSSFAPAQQVTSGACLSQSYSALPISSTARQRFFSTQPATEHRMATAQTMQQRNSLDLALANPVYQGRCMGDQLLSIHTLAVGLLGGIVLPSAHHQSVGLTQGNVTAKVRQACSQVAAVSPVSLV